MERHVGHRASQAANLALLVASLGLALGLAEFVVRRLYPPTSGVMTDFRLLASGYYERDAVLGWRPRKNVHGVHDKPGSFATTFTTNSRGLRDREHRLEKDAATSRLVVVGDSFTWGFGVGDAEVYPRVLESLLDRAEVINLGVTAFETRQEIDYLEMEGLQYRPDIVILGFCLNDIHHPYASIQEEYEALSHRRQPVAPAPQGALARSKLWLHDHVKLYELLLRPVNSNRTVIELLVRAGVKDDLLGYEALDDNLTPALRVYPEELRLGFEKTQAELRELHSVLAAKNIRFVLALIPSQQTVDPRAFEQTLTHSVFEPADFDLRKPYRLLEEFARDEGIEVVDAYPALRRRHEAGERLYLKRDLHFNPAGHRVFAGEIAAFLTSHPSPRP